MHPGLSFGAGVVVGIGFAAFVRWPDAAPPVAVAPAVPVPTVAPATAARVPVVDDCPPCPACDAVPCVDPPTDVEAAAEPAAVAQAAREAREAELLDRVDALADECGVSMAHATVDCEASPCIVAALETSYDAISCVAEGMADETVGSSRMSGSIGEAEYGAFLVGHQEPGTSAETSVRVQYVVLRLAGLEPE